MKVAVVILNWNGEKMLVKYLPTLLQHLQESVEVFVADNASTDGSVALLKEKFPSVKRILLDKNWGFAEGYNQALRQINATYYILLNSDIEVSSGWLSPLITWMDAHPEAAACQPKLLSIRQRDYFEYAGACGGFIDKYGYPFCRGRVFDVVEKDEGQYDEVCPILWATGACLMIRATDYWKVGGLDGRFFAHNEEIDLCWRLRAMGREIYCVPESKVYHVGGGTLPKNNPMKTYLNFRNNLTMLYKNLETDELQHVMRVRWWLDYVAAFKMLILDGHWGDFKAVFKARKAFRKWKKDFDSDRQYLQQHRSVSNRQLLSPYSVLWQYYGKGRHHFSELTK
ncbi:glycosyltransferase family 2 protein [Hoylesella timonensis]|uniref:Glycosyl transferase family 2 n=1 Tax=Hoylesella timonensis S9-PR14 TaxID=1401062 RepID=A0A098YW02_9BACT|nr:glycosyltransferase family 2 protein [Hoylesella timonensis]KGI22753.1 glycosyl transferase family 2 [Hoylesella timonensis S9-PR14]